MCVHRLLVSTTTNIGYEKPNEPVGSMQHYCMYVHMCFLFFSHAKKKDSHRTFTALFERWFSKIDW